MRPRILSGVIPSAMGFPGAVKAAGITYADAVDFPGSTSEGFDRSGNNTGVADTAFISVSLWVIKDSNTGLYIIRSSGDRRLIQRANTDTFRVILRNGAGTAVFDWSGTNNVLPADGNWHHIAFYVDLSTATPDYYFVVDGTEDTATASTATGTETIDHTDSGFAIGNQVLLGAASWDGGISNLGVWPRKIDWSVGATLALVYSGGKCVELPDDGNIDAGGTADYVFNKATSTAHQNGGDASDWGSATGGLSDRQGPEIA